MLALSHLITGNEREVDRTTQLSFAFKVLYCFTSNSGSKKSNKISRLLLLCQPLRTEGIILGKEVKYPQSKLYVVVMFKWSEYERWMKQAEKDPSLCPQGSGREGL